jgi:hypothetical protein
MARKTANDYRKERLELIRQTAVLDSRIRKRANDVCKKFPATPIGKGTASDYINKFGDGDTRQFPNGEWINVGIEGALEVIADIEKYLLEQCPFKQTTIEGF